MRAVDGARVAAAVVARPRLWATAVRQCRRTAPAGWWRRAPFLPVPSGEYLRFRLVTQYGRDDAHIAVPDVIDYLAWCREQDRLGRVAR